MLREHLDRLGSVATRRPPRDRLTRRKARAAIATAIVLACLATASPIDASFPGPDGLVAFGKNEGNRAQFQIALYTMNPDGSSVRQLTRPGWGHADQNAAWSPDATKVVFDRSDFAANNSDLFVVNADGTGLRQLTDCSSVPGCGGYFDPSWSPDGTSLYFSYCCIEGNGGTLLDIWAMNVDGTNLHRVTFNDDLDCADTSPKVSPDGKWLAFTRGIGDGLGDGNCVSALFLVHPNGTGLHQVTSYDLLVDEKDWSPDGSRIVFVSHKGSNTGPFRADLYTVAPDGSNLTQLTHTTPGQTFAFRPSWAPAGDRIMFDYYPGTNGTTDMYTMRPDGSDVRIVAATDADENGLAWGTAPVR